MITAARRVTVGTPEAVRMAATSSRERRCAEEATPPADGSGAGPPR